MAKRDHKEIGINQFEIIRKHHRFLRDSDDEEPNKEVCTAEEKYGRKMANKYEQQLFKEHALVDLTRYETGQIGCRWRTRKQVQQKKGYLVCAQVHCDAKTVNTFEMNFGYSEQGFKKNALVKVSLCKECALKLNYKKLHKIIHEARNDWS